MAAGGCECTIYADLGIVFSDLTKTNMCNCISRAVCDVAAIMFAHKFKQIFFEKKNMKQCDPQNAP